MVRQARWIGALVVFVFGSSGAAADAPEPTLLGRHDDSIMSVAFSPDGAVLASGSFDGRVRLWDVGKGEVRAELVGHAAEISSVVFSPDGNTLATGSHDARVILWDVATGERKQTLRSDRLLQPGWERDLAARVSRVALGFGLPRQLLGAPRQRRDAFAVTAVLFSADGTKLAAASHDDSIAIWMLDTGKLLTKLDGHSSAVTSMARQPDGRLLASGSSDETVKLWNLEEANPVDAPALARRRKWGNVSSLAFSPDGEALAIVTPKYVEVWSMAERRRQYALRDMPEPVRAARFSLDGRLLATACGKYRRRFSFQFGVKEGGSAQVKPVTTSQIRLHDAATGDELARIEGHGEVGCLDFSPDAQRLATGSRDGRLDIWNVASMLESGVKPDPPAEKPPPRVARKSRMLRPEVEARRRFARAGVLARLNDYEGAIRELTEVIRISPDDAKAYLARGGFHIEQGNHEQAIDDLTVAIRLHPDVALNYTLRAFAHAERSQFDDAMVDVEEAIRLDPNSARTFSLRGSLRLRQRDLEGACDDYTQAIRCDPNSATPYFQRGVSRNRLRQYDQAISDFSDAIRLDPDNPTFYKHRSVAWRSKGEYRPALADCNQWIEIDSNDPNAFMQRGRLSSWLGEYENSIGDYTEAVRLDPSHANAYYYRALDYGRAREYEKAIDDYRQVFRLSPTHVMGHLQYARLRATCPEEQYRDGELAVEHATTGCEDFKTEWSLGVLAAAHAEAGDFETAVHWQSEAVQLATDSRREDAQQRLQQLQDRRPIRDAPE